MSPRFLILISALSLGALALAAPAVAQEGDPALVVFRPDDGAMTCRQMADEAAGLSAQMGGRGGAGVFGAMGEVAKSGAAMLIPGAGLAMAGVDALTREGRERREAEEAAVEHRWYYLNGLYAGRCDTQQATVQTPAPQVQVQPAPTN